MVFITTLSNYRDDNEESDGEEADDDDEDADDDDEEEEEYDVHHDDQDYWGDDDDDDEGSNAALMMHAMVATTISHINDHQPHHDRCHQDCHDYKGNTSSFTLNPTARKHRTPKFGRNLLVCADSELARRTHRTLSPYEPRIHFEPQARNPKPPNSN